MVITMVMMLMMMTTRMMMMMTMPRLVVAMPGSMYVSYQPILLRRCIQH